MPLLIGSSFLFRSLFRAFSEAGFPSIADFFCDGTACFLAEPSAGAITRAIPPGRFFEQYFRAGGLEEVQAVAERVVAVYAAHERQEDGWKGQHAWGPDGPDTRTPPPSPRPLVRATAGTTAGSPVRAARAIGDGHSLIYPDAS